MNVDFRNGKIMSEGKEFEGIVDKNFVTREGDPKYKNRIEVKEGVLNGKSVIYSPESKLVSESEFKDGILDGVTKDYFENGKLMRVAHFDNGMKNGDEIRYFQDGQIEHKASFKDGKKVNLELFYYGSGQLKVKVDWEKGNEFEELYESGERKILYKSGKEIHYFKDGAVKIEANYRNGQYEGEVKTYYESGQLRSTANYHQGNIHGKEIIYHENNKIAFKGNYKHGKKEGIVQEGNVKGVIKYEARYQFGDRNGPEKFYNESGEIERVKYFSKGRQLNEIPFEVWNREVKEKMEAGVIEIVPDNLEKIDIKRFTDEEHKDAVDSNRLRWQSDGRADYDGVVGTYDTKSNTFIPDPIKYPGVIGLNEKQVDRYMKNGRLEFEEDGAVKLDGLYGEFDKETNKFISNPNEYSNRVNFYDEKMMDLQGEMPPYFCEADIEGMTAPPDWVSPELAKLFPKLNEYQREKMIDRMFKDEQDMVLRADMKGTYSMSM